MSYPYTQKEHDDAVAYGGIIALVVLGIIGLVFVVGAAWILLVYIPKLIDAAWFALESIWFLAFQLFG